MFWLTLYFQIKKERSILDIEKNNKEKQPFSSLHSMKMQHLFRDFLQCIVSEKRHKEEEEDFTNELLQVTTV